MNCCNKNPITIYQGFGTNWNDESLLTVTFDTEILLDGFGAEFSIGNIVKTYENIENGFTINLTAQETATLPLGAITGTLVIIDTENNKRPFSTELPFLVKDWAEGDIKLDGFNVSINAKIQENKLIINIQSANPGATTEEMIKRYIAIHNQSEEAHTYIQELIESEKQARISADEILQGNIETEQERAETAEETLDEKIDSEITRATSEENKKVDKVSTANRVYGTDVNGNQTTYPVDGFGKVDDVRVGGVSVVQNKIANLGTMASETASDYRKASAQDVIDTNLANGIEENWEAFRTERKDREAADVLLGKEIEENWEAFDTERGDRAAADRVLSNRIANNEEAIGDIDFSGTRLEDMNLTEATKDLLSDINREREDREAADIVLSDVIEEQVTTIGRAMDAEAEEREAADVVLSNRITNNKNSIGTLSSLTTDSKNDLVSAINEVDSHVDINTSNISDIQSLIPNGASSSNRLADKGFVNSSISTNTANFIGTFNSVAELEAYSGTLTNNDYAFVIGTDSAGNTVYDRYKYTDSTTPASWIFEYELNNSSFTADQWAAINSLATAGKITQITTNQNAIGTLSSLTTTAKTSLVNAINELDSDKLDKNIAITGATKCKITYDGKGLVTAGADLSASDIPSLTLSKISDVTATASELNVLDGITASTTELNYTDGVTSNIQTQLDGKVPNTRTINGKALSSNITLNAGDVGALPNSTVIPSKTSDLTNDSGFISGITSTMVTTALGYTPYNSTNPNGYQANVLEGVQVNGTDLTITNKKVNLLVPTQASDIGAQPTLVSGTNIKTINNQSLLGSGNIEIQSAPDVDNKSISLNSSDELQTIGVINQNNTTTALKQWSGTKAQYDAIATKDANTVYNITDDTNPIQEVLLEAIYPVGAIYIGTMNICPLSALFGTWQLVAQDRVLQGAGTRGSVGTTINESLPNITGSITNIFAEDSSRSGAIDYDWSTANYIGTGTGEAITLKVDASLSSSTYQDNAPVQQNAYLVNIWQRIA